MRQPPFGRLCKGKRKECNHFWTAWLSNVETNCLSVNQDPLGLLCRLSQMALFFGSPFSDCLFVPLVIVSSLVSGKHVPFGSESLGHLWSGLHGRREFLGAAESAAGAQDGAIDLRFERIQGN